MLILRLSLMKVGDTHPHPISLSPPFLSCNPCNLADFKFHFHLLSNGITIVHWSLQHWERTPGFTHDRHVLYQMTIPWTLTVTSLSVYSSLFKNTIIHHMTALQVHWWNTDNGDPIHVCTQWHHLTECILLTFTPMKTNLPVMLFLKHVPTDKTYVACFYMLQWARKRFYIKNILGAVLKTMVQQLRACTAHAEGMRPEFCS